MTLKEKFKQDSAVMYVLKVDELSHILGQTDKGVLTLKITKGKSEKDYCFYLDAVPYPKETNDKLLELFDGVLWEKECGKRHEEDMELGEAEHD